MGRKPRHRPKLKPIEKIPKESRQWNLKEEILKVVRGGEVQIESSKETFKKRR